MSFNTINKVLNYCTICVSTWINTRRLPVFVFLCISVYSVKAQDLPKKNLTADDYDLWGTLRIDKISNNGKWVSYKIDYDSKQDTLFVRNTSSLTTHNFAKGYAGTFMDDDHFSCLRKDMGLIILNLKTDQQELYEDVILYEYFKKTKRLVLQCRNKERKSWIEIRDLNSKLLKTITGVQKIYSNPQGNRLICHADDGSVFLVELNNILNIKTLINTGIDNISMLVWNADGNSIAFTKENPYKDGKNGETILYHYDVVSNILSHFEPMEYYNFSQKMHVSVNGGISLKISNDGEKVFFGIKEEKGTIINDNIVQIWNADDHWIYPDIKKNDWGNGDKIGLWYPKSKRFYQITTKQQPISFLAGKERYAITCNPMQVKKQGNMFEKTTFYITDLNTEKKQILLNDQSSDMTKTFASPDGKYITYFKNDNWWIYEISTGLHINMTENQKVSFQESEDKYPGDSEPWGFAGWTFNDQSLLLYDQYDIWEIIPHKSAIRLTKGRESGIVFRLAINNNQFMSANFHGLTSLRLPEINNILLEAKNPSTGFTGYYLLNHKGGSQQLIYKNARVSTIIKADKKEIFAYLEQTYNKPPALIIKKSIQSKPEIVMQSNQQQQKYYWGSSELITYKNPQGNFSKAALFYPANYNASQKYPMIVMIYQSLSGQLHRYINPSEYNETGFNISNLTTQGYFVLLPDIVYQRSEPGISAQKCVVNACKSLIDKGLVDDKKIGLFGHSFGAYEAIFTITQTNMFAAAIAGAAVTDLTSFYFSFDSGMGVAQNYHLENQQWRMDKPFYEDILSYDRNSPIRHASNVTTPLLSWTGNNDMHAGWHQTVEFHLALRRLNKSSIMLIYPEEEHSISLPIKQKDLTQRVQDWFAYYLKNAKESDWMMMDNGI